METDTITPPQPPRTLTVLGMLALTALTFSYLAAYALTNALVAAQVIQPWPRDHDPRPRRLIVGFCVLMLIFMVLGEIFRRLSKSEFKAIDEMANAADKSFDDNEQVA
jgi:hypothetical protein